MNVRYCHCGNTFEPKVIGGREKVYCSRYCKDKGEPKKLRASERYMNMTYGISLEERDSLRQQQNFRCAICKRHEEEIGLLRVDHDHATGKVRGMLCHGCNISLGHFLDDPEIVDKAAAYLRKSRVYAP